MSMSGRVRGRGRGAVKRRGVAVFDVAAADCEEKEGTLRSFSNAPPPRVTRKPDAPERKLLPPEPDALIPGAPTTRYAYVGGSGGSEKEGGMCFSVPFCNFWQNFL